jgi:hypothetical protein
MHDDEDEYNGSSRSNNIQEEHWVFGLDESSNSATNRYQHIFAKGEVG